MRPATHRDQAQRIDGARDTVDRVRPDLQFKSQKILGSPTPSQSSITSSVAAAVGSAAPAFDGLGVGAHRLNERWTDSARLAIKFGGVGPGTLTLCRALPKS